MINIQTQLQAQNHIVFVRILHFFYNFILLKTLTMKNLKTLLKKSALFCLSVSFFLISTEGFGQRKLGGHGGGIRKSGNPAQTRPARQTKPATQTRPGANGSGVNNKATRPANSGNRNNTTNINRNNNTINKNGNRNTNISGRTRNNNNVNINVNNNINVRNNRNTVVRRNNTIVYVRPPYRYGGYRYNTFHPYYYHPYRPYYWGPVWHPWGFFVATLAVTAIVVSVESTQYHYDQGVWYSPSSGGYTAVPAPVGGTVNNIPSGAQTVNTGTVNNYYYGGTYYEKDGNNYKVVAPTAGTLVESLPEGGEEVTIGDVKYIKFGETYYQPVKVDGKDKYEVALVEEDK